MQEDEYFKSDSDKDAPILIAIISKWLKISLITCLTKLMLVLGKHITMMLKVMWLDFYYIQEDELRWYDI